MFSLKDRYYHHWTTSEGAYKMRRVQKAAVSTNNKYQI